MIRAYGSYNGRLVALCVGAAALQLVTVSALGQVGTSKHLYTEPDKTSKGGIRGRLSAGSDGLVAAFAIPSADPLKVYRGEVRGERSREFLFTGLPVAKYDLVLAFEDRVWEGMRLVRGAGSLSSNDVAGIEGIIHRSEPYFNEKVIHRLDGSTGDMSGHARAFCTFLRSKTSTGFVDGKPYHDHRRSLKLVLLTQVGPGWQVERTREVFVRMVPPGTGHVKHFYLSKLGGIRVTDDVKDMGTVSLPSITPKAATENSEVQTKQ